MPAICESAGGLRAFGANPPYEAEAHEHEAGATSAHNRPLAPRVASTRTQAPEGSRLCILLGSLAPACGSDHTGSIIFAVKIMPGGGNEVSEIAYPVKVGTQTPD